MGLCGEQLMTSNQTTAIAIFAVGSFVAALLIGGHRQAADYFSALSYSVTSLAAVLWVWERWLWSWKYLNPLLTTHPDLRGTWKGYFVSDWIDPETNRPRGRIEAYLVIRQTFSSVDVRLHTVESGSTALSANIIEDGQGLHTVAVLYENSPSIHLRQKSPIGHGGMLLHVRGNPIHQLDGEYWTERKTKGAVHFDVRAEELCSDFEHCKRQSYRQLVGKNL
jgi:SMODS-associating 2TM, beta-strand rich effector domain